MKEDTRAGLLKDEYIMLQEQYEEMDTKGLTIKNWAITVALGIVGACLVYDNKNLLWLGIAASLMFWYLEGYWRGLSHFFAHRIQIIEMKFRNDNWLTEKPLQFYNSWNSEYSSCKDQTLKYMFKRASLLPHVVIPFIFLILYFIL